MSALQDRWWRDKMPTGLATDIAGGGHTHSDSLKGVALQRQEPIRAIGYGWRDWWWNWTTGNNWVGMNGIIRVVCPQVLELPNTTIVHGRDETGSLWSGTGTRCGVCTNHTTGWKRMRALGREYTGGSKTQFTGQCHWMTWKRQTRWKNQSVNVWGKSSSLLNRLPILFGWHWKSSQTRLDLF